MSVTGPACGWPPPAPGMPSQREVTRGSVRAGLEIAAQALAGLKRFGRQQRRAVLAAPARQPGERALGLLQQRGGRDGRASP